MNDFYVYRYIRLDLNIPFYVGKGRDKRISELHNRNQYFKNIIKKTPYRAEIVLKNLNEPEAFKKEIEFIALYKKIGYCAANLTLGGEGSYGYEKTKECIEKIRVANIGKFVSEETKKRISASKIGCVSWMKGKSHSEESKAKNSRSHIGKPAWNKGKTTSKETREKISKSNIGKSTWNKGKQMSEESKQKMIETKQKRMNLETINKMSESARLRDPNNVRSIICINTGIIYKSISEAATTIRTSKCSIFKHLKSGSKRRDGLVFLYVFNEKTKDPV